MRTLFALSIVLVAWPVSGLAQDGHGFGIGADLVSSLGNGLGGGAGVSFDGGSFVVDGQAAFFDVEDTSNDLGLVGRGYFLVHRANSADLGIGGGVGVLRQEHTDVHGMRIVHQSEVGVLLEAGARVRAFVVPNVALCVSLGVTGLLIDPANTITFGSRLAGSAGLIYYFR